MARQLRHAERVRYSECDAQGVVFNANYLTLFDLGMTELWREAIAPWDEFVERGYDMVVAEATVRYLAPLRFDEVFEICAAVARIGTTSLQTSLWIERDGERVAEGDLRHVFVTAESGEKTEIPDDVHRALEAYLIDA